MCLVFHVEHLIGHEYAFERPDMCSTWNVLFPWIRFEKPQGVSRGALVPSECSLNLMFRPYASATAFQREAPRTRRRVFHVEHMRRADCLAQRGRLTQNWLIRI